jgi:phosphoribosylanthranilate isomerase
VLEAHERVGLAGNLSPDNVREALAAAGPGVWLVDAASSLESFPGVKSPELVERFVRAARGRGE